MRARASCSVLSKSKIQTRRDGDRKSTRLNSSHDQISYAVFCLKKKNTNVGTASASATYGGDANHLGNTGTGSFSISQAASTTTVSCPVGPYTYDGTAHTPCSAT